MRKSLFIFLFITVHLLTVAQTTIFFDDFGQSTVRKTSLYMPTGPNCFIFADPTMVDNAATTSYDEAYNSKELENNHYAVVAPSCIYTSVSAGFVPGYKIWDTSVADHTGNTNGAVLVVNGGTTLNSFYKRPITLTAGQYYHLSFYYYVINSTVNIGARIMSPSGNSTLKTLSTGDLSTSSGWTNFTADFFVPTGCKSETCFLSLVNLKELNQGNDFMVDDIMLQQVTSSTSYSTITCLGAEPTATNDSKINQIIGSTITIDPFANDILANRSTIATISNSSITLLAPQGGSLTSQWYGYSIVVPNEGEWKYSIMTWDANYGKLQFVPKSVFTGNPTPVYYTLTDNSTGTTSALATVTVTYNGSPIAVADVTSANVGSTANVSILANDKMADGVTTPTTGTVSVTLIAPTGGTSTGTSVTMPNEGTWTYSAGNLAFVPLPTFTKSPTPISYKITMGTNSSAPVTVTITMTTLVIDKPAVVVVDNIISPTGDYKIGDIVQFTFDLHNVGPAPTINPITINYKLSSVLSFVPSGSTAIFSQSGSTVSGIQNAVMSVGGKQSYILKFQIQGSACPATNVGADPLGCTGDGFLTISGGAELSPGYLRWREWGAWGTGGRENYVDERISLYFPVGQDTPLSTTTVANVNTGIAPASDADYYYDKTHTNLDAKVISQAGNGTRKTWEWYGIIVPDETTDYTFCGSQIDDGWAAWINEDWNPQAGQSLDPSQMVLIGENYTYQAGTNISTPNFHLICGRPYFFRIVVSSRNVGNDNNRPYGYSQIALRKVSQSTCDQQWAPMVGESMNIPLRININCPPTVKNDAVSTEESTASNGNVFADNGFGVDSDINGDTYTVTKINGLITNVGSKIPLDKGFLTVNANGTFSFDPNGKYEYLGVGQTTVVSFTYNATDARGLQSDLATAQITITGTNDLPVTANDNSTTAEDISVLVNITANDIDIDGTIDLTTVDLDPIASGRQTTYSIAGQGTYKVDDSGVLTFTPVANYNGIATPIKYNVKDNSGATSNVSSINITVTAVNDLPVAVNDNVSTNEDTSKSGTLATNDTPSGDGGNVWSKASDPSHGTAVVNADGMYTYIPSPNYNGSDSFTYKITDVDGDISTATVNLTVVSVNDLPVAVNDNVSTNENTPKSGTLATNDTPSGDAGNVWSKATDPSHGTAVVNADGMYTYIPSPNYNGSDNFTYKITDANNDVSTATVSISVTAVDDLPDAVNDNVSTNENTPKSGTLATNDTPSGDGGNVWSKVTNPAHGTVVVNSDGTYTYTPVANYNGSDSFTYKITDVDGDISTATVSISVASVNDLPVAVNDNVSTNEDTPKSGTLATNDTPSGDGGNVWSKVTNPAHGTVVVNADGTYTYTPVANYNGSDSFTYKITDVDGDISTATVNVTVISVNDVPVAIADNVSTNEDAALSGTLATNDTPSGDSGNVWSKVTNPAHGTVVVNADGTYTYTPVANYNGFDSFTYKITDGDGDISTATVSISVASVNDLPVAVNDNVSTNEDTPKNGTLATNDTPSGDGGNVWSKVIDPSHGTIVVNADGTYTYTPVANYNGSDSFTYKITDGDGDISTATANLTVVSVNDLPVAVNDNVSTNEDTPKNGTLATNDTPSDDGGNVWSKTTDPLHGAVVVNADGTYTYTPVANYNGSDSFTYKITDGDGDISTATVSISVASVNDFPVAVDDIVSTPENTALNGSLATNDTPSGDGGNVWSKVSDPANGIIVVNVDGSYTYTPNAIFSGTDNFTYKITDVDGDVSSATVTVLVSNTNYLPVAADDIILTNEDTPINGSLATNDILSLDGTNHWSKTTDPIHGTVIVNDDGTYTYTPTANYNGVDGFTYKITDPDGDVSNAKVSVTVTSVNDIPIAVDDNSESTNEDTPKNGNLASNDTPSGDGGNIWVVNSNPSNGTVVVNADGTYAYIPTVNYNGTDNFTYSVIDADGDKSIATVTMNITAVNDAPQAADDVKSTNEDTPTTISVLSNDTDVDGDALTVTGTTTPANGTAVMNGDGTITYTPIVNYHGQDTFDYTISDGSVTSTATVTVTVTAVNDAPQATNDSKITNEDTPTTISVLSNDTDVDVDALTVITTTSPSHGNAVVNADGTITYTPTANFHGSDTFDYTISDGNGGTSIATVTITVASVNNTPLAANDVATTNEDVPMTITVLSNDTDGDGDVLSVIGVTPPLNGGAVVNINGTITYTPNPNFNGTDTFKYKVTDGNGGTSTATVTIIVNSVNDAPTTVNDIGSTDEDIPVLIAVLSNDTDVDSDTLSVTATTAPSHGTVIVKSEGTIIYTPNPNFNGTDAFDYSVSDGNGGVSTATVSITVNSVNDAPLAVTDAITTNEDTPVIINALTNDIDVDGDPLSVVSITNPLHGTAVVNTDGTITYIPEANFNGTDAFDYTITDGNGASSTATVNLVVNSVNDNPLAINDAGSIEENNQIGLPVLNNDTDPEGDILTVIKTTKPANGELTVNTNGTIIYVPNADFHGIDTFNYTVSDGNGGQSTAVVSINVFKVNRAPVAKNDSRSTKVNTPVVILVLGNDVDLDGDALTITESTAPANGNIFVNSDGTITYTPNAGFSGTDSFYYTITDGYAVSTAKVTVTIDVTTILLPKVWKKTSKPELNSDGSFSWTYTITVYNDTNHDIVSAQVVDDLDGVFKDVGCTYQVTSIVAYGTLWANGLYNGSGVSEMLISDSSYVKAGSMNSIVMTVKVDSHNYVGNIFNQASFSGLIHGINYPFSNILSDDVSFNGLNDKTVTIISDVMLIIPEGFSPNDDNFNQTFVIKHADYSQLNMMVYNRWGNLVYKSSDYHGEWDGKGTGNFLGKDLPTGTYYCVYKLINRTTGEIMTTGVKFITLGR